jgi:hypothetical protein
MRISAIKLKEALQAMEYPPSKSGASELLVSFETSEPVSEEMNESKTRPLQEALIFHPAIRTDEWELVGAQGKFGRIFFSYL